MIAVCKRFLATSALILSVAALAAGQNLSHTSPEGWSTDGGFNNLKWGMGPADVRGIFPKLMFMERKGPVGGYLAEDFVEGMRVHVHCRFYKGRLYRVRLIASRFGTTSSDDVGLEEWKAREKTWVNRLKPILQEKYGDPTEDTYGYAPAWTWHRGRTSVQLISSPAAAVSYADVAVANEADAAQEASRTAEEKARRSRL